MKTGLTRSHEDTKGNLKQRQGGQPQGLPLRIKRRREKRQCQNHGLSGFRRGDRPVALHIHLRHYEGRMPSLPGGPASAPTEVGRRGRGERRRHRTPPIFRSPQQSSTIRISRASYCRSDRCQSYRCFFLLPFSFFLFPHSSKEGGQGVGLAPNRYTLLVNQPEPSCGCRI